MGPIVGFDITSATMPAIVATTTVKAPHRRPRFQVTRPIGIRYRSASERFGVR